MPKSLLEQLPEIVAKGRQQAEKILESIESRHRVQLQTREIVLPAKDSANTTGLPRKLGKHGAMPSLPRKAHCSTPCSPA